MGMFNFIKGNGKTIAKQTEQVASNNLDDMFSSLDSQFDNLNNDLLNNITEKNKKIAESISKRGPGY